MARNFLHMHIDAVAAAVDLRGAQLDRLQKSEIEPAIMDESMQPAHGLHASR
jgi:hypothetical protein